MKTIRNIKPAIANLLRCIECAYDNTVICIERQLPGVVELTKRVIG